MGVLTDICDDRIATNHGVILVNPAFDTVLDIQKLYLEDVLTEYEKVDQALKMLVKNKWNLCLFSKFEKIELLVEISKRFIQIKKRPPVRQDNVPVLDFEEDGDYIYSSFMRDYHIDLIDQQGRLPWKKFLYLFKSTTES